MSSSKVLSISKSNLKEFPEVLSELGVLKISEIPWKTTVMPNFFGKGAVRRTEILLKKYPNTTFRNFERSRLCQRRNYCFCRIWTSTVIFLLLLVLVVFFKNQLQAYKVNIKQVKNALVNTYSVWCVKKIITTLANFEMRMGVKMILTKTKSNEWFCKSNVSPCCNTT